MGGGPDGPLRDLPQEGGAAAKPPLGVEHLGVRGKSGCEAREWGDYSDELLGNREGSAPLRDRQVPGPGRNARRMGKPVCGARESGDSVKRVGSWKEASAYPRPRDEDPRLTGGQGASVCSGRPR